MRRPRPAAAPSAPPLAPLLLAPLLLACAPGAGGQDTPSARGREVAAFVRAERWAEADSAAAAHPDPVARKLVLYFRLLAPGAARAGEIAAFMSDSPDWPQQGLLSRRLQDAIAAEGDDRAVLAVCAARPPQAPPSLLRCAEAGERAAGSGDPVAARAPDPAAAARQAWIAGVTDPAGEAAFLRRWGRDLTPDDQWARFDRLAWSDTPAPNGPAARQIARLDPSLRPVAQARLALRRDDSAAPALLNALPEARRADPTLVLEHARFLRRAGQDAQALAVWTAQGTAAEAAAPAERKAAFWEERNLLARRLLRQDDPAGAYALASGHAQGSAQTATEQALDAEFLAGWIALRRLGRPEAATAHFRALAGSSKAAITQARAQYWLGRAAQARGDAEAARAAFAAAAAWPTTYYGQLAARAAGEDDAALAERIRAARDPEWTAERALDFAGREQARAAALLAAWGEPRRARAFLQRLDERAEDPADRALAARFALGLGMPDQAVALARRAGRDGLVLPEAGWPLAVEPPEGAVEAAVLLGLMRQESNFDAQAASGAGARGLMQLMPATAAEVARRLGEPVSVPALTADPAYNMRLGTRYLQGLLERFGGALPYALAGYNAGPSRVQEWLAAHGDPAQGRPDAPDRPGMVDWIELIPFNETRNYVQRVIENVVIYRARRGAAAPHPLARWL